MKTQLKDLKIKLKDAEANIRYCKHKGKQGKPIYKYFLDRRDTIISTINNIR
tara:strand:- start:16173 stop:16328 length:156 start_codon:yes stop_codon:yes gene_type:complete